MSWYRAGTVAVTNGNAIVTGTNTDFVSNTQVGEIFVGPDLKVYEIDVVTSAAQISIKPPYQSASGAGQTYGIAPTQSFARDLALAFAGFKNTFGGILDTIGQGLFTDGSINAPAVRFASDQDTGLYKYAANVLGVGAGGSISTLFDGDGALVRRRLRIGLGDPGAQGSTEILTTGTSPVATRLAFGTDGTGYQFAISKNQGGLVYDLVNVIDSGRVGIGTTNPLTKLHVNTNGSAPSYSTTGNDNGGALVGVNGTGDMQLLTFGGGKPIIFGNYNQGGAQVEYGRFDGNGNLLVGASSGSSHVIAKTAGEGATVLDVTNGANGYVSARFASVVSPGLGNAANAALFVGRASNNRSINAPGTINAGGADYAEYVRKSLACGTIPKGDVCGIDGNGQLTRTWADARRYVVKSTDPNLVGGDTWAAHLGPRPEAPLYAAPAYDGPVEPTKPVEPAAFVPPVIEMPVQPVRGDGEDDDAYLLRLAAFLNDRNATIAMAQAAADAQVEAAKAQVAYTAAVEQYQADLAAYRDAQAAYRTAVDAAEAAHAVALAAHGEALTAWEAELEAARQTVDRIAFSGQVPVNVDADTLAACQAALGDGVAVYLVAVARGAGIGVTAVREADMTLQQYMRRLGAVWAIRDGRPWIDVQHG